MHVHASCSVSRVRTRHAQKLPDLPYDYSALEPVISGEIMELHHAKHHATYVANFNNAAGDLEAADEAGDVAKLITLEPAIKFNGGGEPQALRAQRCIRQAPGGGCARTHAVQHFVRCMPGSLQQLCCARLLILTLLLDLFDGRSYQPLHLLDKPDAAKGGAPPSTAFSDAQQHCRFPMLRDACG